MGNVLAPQAQAGSIWKTLRPRHELFAPFVTVVTTLGANYTPLSLLGTLKSWALQKSTEKRHVFPIS